GEVQRELPVGIGDALGALTASAPPVRSEERCSICKHRERAAIDLALARGVSPAALAKRYGFGATDGFFRHRRNHMPAQHIRGQVWPSRLLPRRLLPRAFRPREEADGVSAAPPV